MYQCAVYVVISAGIVCDYVCISVVVYVVISAGIVCDYVCISVQCILSFQQALCVIMHQCPDVKTLQYLHNES